LSRTERRTGAVHE